MTITIAQQLVPYTYRTAVSIIRPRYEFWSSFSLNNCLINTHGRSTIMIRVEVFRAAIAGTMIEEKQFYLPLPSQMVSDVFHIGWLQFRLARNKCTNFLGITKAHICMVFFCISNCLTHIPSCLHLDTKMS